MKYLFYFSLLMTVASCQSYDKAIKMIEIFTPSYDGMTFSKRTQAKCAKIIINDFNNTGNTYSYTYAPECMMIWCFKQIDNNTFVKISDVKDGRTVTEQLLPYTDNKPIAKLDDDRNLFDVLYSSSEFTLTPKNQGAIYLKWDNNRIKQYKYMPQIGTLEKIEIDTISNPVIKEYAQTLMKYIKPMIK